MLFLELSVNTSYLHQIVKIDKGEEEEEKFNNNGYNYINN